MDDLIVLEKQRATVAKAGQSVDGGGGGERPGDPPDKFAPFDERADWTKRFLEWAYPPADLAAPHPDSGVLGHLWRVEFAACVLDPQGYERQFDEEWCSLKGG